MKAMIQMKTTMLLAVSLGLAACSGPKNLVSQVPQGLDKQGHRGARGLMPENTIPAMLHALDLGVTTLEMDLVISKDEQVVVSHDPYFHHNITTGPGGQTFTKGEGEKLLLYTMPYDSIRKYDVGTKPHPDYPRQKKMAVHKPLLAALLEATETYKASKPFYNIEIKSKKENDGKKHPPIERFVDLAMAVVQEKGIAARTTIQSFDPRALQVLHRKYPSQTASLLIEGDDRRGLDQQLQELGFTPQVYSPHYSLVTRELVDACHNKKMRIIPWTVNRIEEMKRLITLGVDGIITDYPDLFQQL